MWFCSCAFQYWPEAKKLKCERGPQVPGEDLEGAWVSVELKSRWILPTKQMAALPQAAWLIQMWKLRGYLGSLQRPTESLSTQIKFQMEYKGNRGWNLVVTDSSYRQISKGRREREICEKISLQKLSQEASDQTWNNSSLQQDWTSTKIFIVGHRYGSDQTTKQFSSSAMWQTWR